MGLSSLGHAHDRVQACYGEPMRRLVLTAVVLALACVPLVASVGLSAYPVFEAAPLTSAPDHMFDDDQAPYGDYVLAAMAIHYLHKKRLHERWRLPFRPTSADEFREAFSIAHADSEILEMIGGKWCGTALAEDRREFTVAELRTKARQLLREHRARVPFLDAYRTVCTAPPPQLIRTFGELRTLSDAD